ncbi:MAG: amino acid adenylation domain-containing protein, partial [Clostridiaceae bacterium]|nr:amino acid adenylation domain-containing protein [Clostridiaceae bacterium]
KYAGFGFDASVWEIFPYIVSGASLYVVPEEIKLDLDQLNSFFTDNGITMSFLPTQVCEQFMRLDNAKSLRKLLTGGDKLREFIKKPYELINNYGPTENTVVSTSFTVDRAYSNIPIGKPVCNTSILILDKENRLVPLGTAGELCISGDSLARGYLNQPELTDEKFISNPYLPGERMYKTGDLARWLPDGNIEFLGRIDLQVKIRGNRIELGEIEAVLLKLTWVSQAVVVDYEDNTGGKYLCAYIVSEKGAPHKELRSHLQAELPDYMVPSFFMEVDSIPLTANGKVDRKALLKPEGNMNTEASYVAPAPGTETVLQNIWEETLSIDRIGVNDNFFELGGHSLKAATLISRIHRELNVIVPLREVFNSPTIRELAQKIDESERDIYSSIKPVEKREYYPLSPAQHRLYIINQLDSGTSYNIPSTMFMEGELNLKGFENAFNEIIKRHEAFRTSFMTIDGEPVQKIHDEVEFKLEYYECDEEEAKEIVDGFIKPFDFAKAPLLRAGLIKLNDRKYIFMLDMHHIISDGASMTIFVREFMEIYKGLSLPPLKVQYKDYAVWQRELVKSGQINKQEDFWLDTFSGEIPVLEMPTDYKRPSVQSFDGDEVSYNLDKELTQKIRQLCRETGTTLYMVLLAAYNVLVSKYTGQEDIIIGSPVAGRPHADLDSIIGMFVNTLAMRNYPSGVISFREFLAEVKNNSLKAFENQDYQFEELVDRLELNRDLSRNPLFDIAFMLVNKDTDESNDIGGLSITQYEYDTNISKFDMTLCADEGEDEIGLSIEYCTKLYKKDTLQRMLVHLRNILEKIVENPDMSISGIDMLTEAERKEILTAFNDTKMLYPKDKTIGQLFEQQAEDTPFNTAVVYGEEKLTYLELNEKANQLARVLRNEGVKADTIVAMMVERSLDMIVGIMGILKAGGAYMPIDPGYPRDRIEYMLKDSGTGLLLTGRELTDRVEFEGKILLLEDENIWLKDKDNLEHNNNSENLAYIIYTSGSTGKPKGNLTTHYNVTRVVRNTNYIEVTPDDVLLQLSNYAFDGSVFDIYGALLNGAKLVLVDKDRVADIGKLCSLIEKEKISVFFITTALFNALVDINIDALTNIKHVLFGGERVSLAHAGKALAKLGENRIIHVYGPTESTVFATYHYINEIDEGLGTVPIGKPLANTEIYIVDKYNALQPVGVVGELCIGGDGLAKGYLNRPELTGEKFVQNPFVPGEIMYRTGDLTKWLPDGSVVFIGRIDHQVKIRGFRIELGEIENHLNNMEEIKEALVTVTGEISSEKAICAYYTVNSDISPADLRRKFKETLPDYMIPSYFIELDVMPLNKNGKIDRKALPKPEIDMSEKEYVAPETETEKKMAVIWQEVLGVEKVGSTDNFFELGGHSLKATVLVSKMHKEFNAVIPLRTIFTAPTIKELSIYIENAGTDVYSAISPAPYMEFYPLSSAQKRLYIIDSITERNTAYNIPFTAVIEGKLDVERFSNSIKELVKRHEAFRTAFVDVNGEPMQKIHEDI